MPSPRFPPGSQAGRRGASNTTTALGDTLHQLGRHQPWVPVCPRPPRPATDHRRRPHGTDRPAHRQTANRRAAMAGGLRTDRLRRRRRSREPCAGDGTDDPAPYCAICDGDIGIFLKFGLDWRHYAGTDLTDIELFDPGHQPIVVWRSPGRRYSPNARQVTPTPSASAAHRGRSSGRGVATGRSDMFVFCVTGTTQKQTYHRSHTHHRVSFEHRGYLEAPYDPNGTQ